MKTSQFIFAFLVISLIGGLFGCAPAPALPTPTAVLQGKTLTATVSAPKPTDPPAPMPGGTATPTSIATVALSPTPDMRVEWAQAAEAVTEWSGGQWHMLIREVGGETILSSGEDEVIHPASAIKVAIAALFFATLEQDGPIEDLPKALRERGTDGRSYEQLLRAMLVKSEELAADSLQGWVEERVNPEDVLKSWGLAHTRLTPRRSTLNDLAMLLEGIWAGEWISAPARDVLLGLMAEYTPNDDLRLGVARGCQAQDERFYNKRGTLTDDVLIVGDVALIERGEKWYFSGVFAYQTLEGQPQTTYEALEAGMTDFGGLFCEFLGAGR